MRIPKGVQANEVRSSPNHMLSSWWRRLLVALFIGSVLAIIPNMVTEAAADSPGIVSLIFTLFKIPGVAAALAVAVLAGGNLHDIRSVVVDTGNFAFYTGVAYLILWELTQLRPAKSRQE